MATATFGVFTVGNDASDWFTLQLVYDTTTLEVLQANVVNTTPDPQQFHLGDGANPANPAWSSPVIPADTLSDTLDLSTTPGYSLVQTPRGPRPVNCGTGPALS